MRLNRCAAGILGARFHSRSASPWSGRSKPVVPISEREDTPHDRQEPEPEPVEPISLQEAHKVFKRWLGDDYDTDALDAMLATAAVKKLGDGSPLLFADRVPDSPSQWESWYAGIRKAIGHHAVTSTRKG